MKFIFCECFQICKWRGSDAFPRKEMTLENKRTKYANRSCTKNVQAKFVPFHEKRWCAGMCFSSWFCTAAYSKASIACTFTGILKSTGVIVTDYKSILCCIRNALHVFSKTITRVSSSTLANISTNQLFGKIFPLQFS